MMSDCLTEDERRELLMLAGRMGEILAPDIQPNMDELRQVRARARRQRLHAREVCDELLRVDPKVREEEARQYKKYHAPALIDLLLKRSQAEVLNDPKVSRQLAELALAITDAMYPSPTVPHRTMRDRFALGHALVGNVCRLHCDWSGAHRRFRKARKLLLDGAGDLEIHAQVHRMYAALLRDQQRFIEALRFLKIAMDDYQTLGLDHEVGLVLLSTAIAHRNMDAPQRALKAHMQACDLLDETKAPLLVAAAWNNLAILLCDLGQHEQAASVLDNLPSVFELLPPTSTVPLDLKWARGLVARGLGDIARAEEYFLSVRDSYDCRGDLLSSARVSLDLLRAYFESGRLLEVERFAVSVYQALQAHPVAADIHETFRILTAARAQRLLVEDALNQFATLLSQNPLPGKRSPTTEP
jgi:tetratricopeptide (TPR) repeat protein